MGSSITRRFLFWAAVQLAVLGIAPLADAQPSIGINSPSFWLERAWDSAKTLPPGERAAMCALVGLEYAKAGDVERFRRMVAKLSEAQTSVADSKERLYCYAMLVPGFAMTGDQKTFDTALRDLAAVATDPDSPARSIVRTLADTRHFDQAARLARAAKRANSRCDRLEYLAIAMGQAGDKKDYETTIEAAEKEAKVAIADFPDDKEISLLSLAWAMVRAGDLDRAQKLADSLSSEDSVNIHAWIARKYFLASDRDRYEKTIDRAIELASQLQSRVYAQSAYEQIAEALALANDEGRFTRILQTNEKSKGLIDIDFWFERARIRGEAGDVAAAQSMLKQAVDGFAAQAEDQGSELRFVQLKQLHVVEALAHAGKDDAAMTIVLNVERQPPDGFKTSKLAFQCLAVAQAARGRITAARATLDRYPESTTVKFGEMMPAREFYAASVVEAAAESGQSLDGTAAWIDSFKNANCRTNAYLKIATAMINHDHHYFHDLNNSD